MSEIRHFLDLDVLNFRSLRQILGLASKIKDDYKSKLIKNINNEIKYSFKYAKTSPFPKIKSWNNLNYSNDNLLSKKLLTNINQKKIENNLKLFQPKGY